MAYSEDRLNDIFDKTDGRCHLCGKKLAFQNYANSAARAAWEVEHSVAKARGGTDHLNNLYPACIPCNRSKGCQSTRAVRASYGRTRAPLSRRKKEAIRNKNAAIGVVVGGGLGLILRKPALGAALGAVIGYFQDPEPE